MGRVVGIHLFWMGLGLASTLTMAFSAASQETRIAGPTPQDVEAPYRLETKFLANVIVVHPTVMSGAAPNGDAAFAELSGLGVKTIVSVDGARPDVALAKRYGMRYVHLPHGYDGISMSRARELSKGIATFDKPIYIHCHHGMHRSPAATVVACVGVGILARSQALDVLQLAGTDSAYRGLYRAAESAERMDSDNLRMLEVEFQECAELPPLAEAMVALDATFARLERIHEMGWQTPANNPDIDPAHQALLLREHYKELLRSEILADQLPAFHQMLESGEEGARELVTALEKHRSQPVSSAVALDACWKDVVQNCRDCHQQFRDNPREPK
jgi:protein tyrosine phosphatase (PTP) superfamily phosphohydrolase (DUF442 family)